MTNLDIFVRLNETIKKKAHLFFCKFNLNYRRIAIINVQLDRIEEKIDGFIPIVSRYAIQNLVPINQIVSTKENVHFLKVILRKSYNLLGFKKETLSSRIKKYKVDLTKFLNLMENFILKTDVVLDVGCGIRPQNYFVPRVHICVEPFKQYRDIIKPYFPNNSTYIFIKSDALSALRSFDNDSVDTVFMIDLIEHLDKKEGVLLIEEADRVARKQIIIFTPYGFYPMHFHGEGVKDAWGLDGNEVQEHKSGWTEKDFDKTWEIHICVDCHEAFLPEEKIKNKKYSALMAIKTKKFTGFKVHPKTPNFVKEQYEQNN